MDASRPFPARAGLNRVHPFHHPRLITVPRTRGAEPPILGKDEAESSILSGGSSQEPDFSGFFAPPIVSTRKRVARIMRAIAQGIFVLGLWLGFAASIYVLF